MFWAYLTNLLLENHLYFQNILLGVNLYVNYHTAAYNSHLTTKNKIYTFVSIKTFLNRIRKVMFKKNSN